MEHRHFTRVDFSGRVSIRHNDDIVWGNVDNLSLQGIYIKTPHGLPLHTPLDITIHHSQDSSIHLLASAVHCEDAGTGMIINEFDVDSFVQLRDVIFLKNHDQMHVLNETYKVLRCIL